MLLLGCKKDCSTGRRKVMKLNKKIGIVMISGLSIGLALTGYQNNVFAKTTDNVTWVANKPNQIASLNSNGTYTVRSGDTIWAIGMHYNIKPSVIESVNKISNPYDLQIGTILQLQISKKTDKAVLFVKNSNGKLIGKKTLTKKDKIVKNQAFGKPVSSKEAEKVKAVPTKPCAKAAQSARKSKTASLSSNLNSKAINSSSSSKDSSMPSESILNMLAYLKAYNGTGNVFAKSLEISGNVIGQGTVDSTAVITNNGKDIILKFVSTPGWKPYYVSYPISSLLKEYKNCNKQEINNLITTGENNYNSLQEGPKAAQQTVNNNNKVGQTSSQNSSQSSSHSDSQSSLMPNSESQSLNNVSAAENYLRQKLGLNSDISMVEDSSGTDANGAYYVIALHSKSYESQGGTGTAGIYKVYQNGKVIEQE